jgi:hypothetical protein
VVWNKGESKIKYFFCFLEMEGDMMLQPWGVGVLINNRSGGEEMELNFPQNPTPRCFHR